MMADAMNGEGAGLGRVEQQGYDYNFLHLSMLICDATLI